MFFENRPTVATIHLNHLRHNIRQMTRQATSVDKIMAVVKANAYGHGAIKITDILWQEGVREFAVATIHEALELREYGLGGTLYVLNGLQSSPEIYSRHQLTPVIYDHEQLRDCLKFNEKSDFRVALKFDTGMGRLGFTRESWTDIVKQVESSSLEIAKVMSHLACADQPESSHLKNQVAQFANLKNLWLNSYKKPVSFSLCNSSAMIYDLGQKGDTVRPGLALYGVYPDCHHSKTLGLRAVLQWQTQVFSLKSLNENDTVGYGAVYKVKRPTTIAYLPLGYADGYFWKCSDRTEVLIKGCRAPVVGRVSMDWVAVDVTDIPNVAVGDRVTLLGRDGRDEITANEIAEKVGTIPYEVLCALSVRVPRVYKDEDHLL